MQTNGLALVHWGTRHVGAAFHREHGPDTRARESVNVLNSGVASVKSPAQVGE